MFFLSKSLSHPNLHLGIFGDLVINAMGGFPTKPDVPPPPQLDLQQAQTQSTQGNLAALPGLEDLGGQYNQYAQAQRTKSNVAGIPGYSNLTSSAAGTVGNWLSGSLSPDVASAVQRSSNAKAFAGGFQGSGMGENLTARDLGLTSLDLQRMGMSALPSYLSTMNAIGVAPQLNIASQFTSPEQQLGVNQFNAENQYQNQWLKNLLASIPDPADAAIAKDVGGIADVVGTAALTALGGVGGAAVGGAIAGGAGGASAGGMIGNQLGGAIGGAGGSSGASAGVDLTSLLRGIGTSPGGGTSYSAVPGGPASNVWSDWNTPYFNQSDAATAAMYGLGG